MSNVRERLGRTVTQHDGREHDPRQDFFGPTHVAFIGPIHTAQSTRKTHRSLLTRLLFGRVTSTCSYIGARGVVIHTQRGNAPRETHMLRFQDVAALPDHMFDNLPGGPELRYHAKVAWQRELLRRRVETSLAESEFRFAVSGYQPAT